MFKSLLFMVYTLTPKIYPTNADNTIAIVPQIVIRKIAFLMLEPPVFAAIVPNIIRKIIVKAYNQYSIFFTGANKITSNGKTPPTVNAAPDEIAA